MISRVSGAAVDAAVRPPFTSVLGASIMVPILNEARRGDGVNRNEDSDHERKPRLSLRPAAGDRTEHDHPTPQRVSLDNEMRPALQPHYKSNHCR